MNPLRNNIFDPDEGRLLAAAISGDNELVSALLRQGLNSDAREPGGSTALDLAVQEGHLDIVKTLIAAGATVDSTNDYGNTPLWTAVFNYRGDGRIVEAILAAGADPGVVNNAGQTPSGLAHLIANYDVGKFFPK
jgi:uncharacterized protein